MLSKLKKLIKKYGVTKVCSSLGYRSHTTIYYWLQQKRIPLPAQAKVKTYLESEGL